MKDFIQQIYEDHNDLYIIKGQGKGRVPFSNSLLIADHLIDTGVSPLYLKRIKKKFKINKGMFSHWHDDHIRDNKILSNVPFYCHPECKPIIEDIDKLLDLYDIRGTSVQEKFKIFLSDVINVYDTQIEGTFNSGDTLKIGKYNVKVIETPGHSIGHCAFHIPELRFAFIGDIDLSQFGPWYGGKDSNIVDFIHSIDKISKLNLEKVVTGHQGLFKGASLINNELQRYKAIFKKREDKILYYMNETKPIKSDDLLEKNIIYRNYRFFKPFLLVMEKTMIQKHFEKMVKEDKITHYNNGYVLS